MALVTPLQLPRCQGMGSAWAEIIWKSFVQICRRSACRACRLGMSMARRRQRVPFIKWRRLYFSGLFLSLPLVSRAIENPEELPNLLAGTFTDGQKFSTGNTLPLVGRPWGFNHFAPQTNDGTKAWWFSPAAHEFHWIRLTHQPSPWIGDWGWVLIGPQMGGRVEEPVMFFQPMGARLKPHVLDATLGPDNMRVQLTPSDHGAILKVTFPAVNPANHPKRICFKLPGADKKNPKTGEFRESSEDNMWMEMTSTRATDVPKNFAFYLRAEVDMSTLHHNTENPSRKWRTDKLHCFEFHHAETAITVWIGTSLISAKQAELNLKREVRARKYEEVEEESRLIWRNLMRRIDVSSPGPMTAQVMQRLTLFYTGLWRALSFPRRIDEVDENGKTVHYSPYSHVAHTFDGPLVTDNGFWDTFRTVYPLLNLAYPVEAGLIVEGWLNAFKEGQWLPEWASPGYRTCMIGTFADVVVADAVLKDLPGVDHDLAWKAISKDSFQAGGRKGQGGKANYKEYSEKNYIPAERSPDSVSGTLDYAFSDFSVSVVAEKLGKTEDANKLKQRALQARAHLFDRKSGMMRPKTAFGVMKEGDAKQWGGGYVEGSAWHHSFPPFDLQGLVKLHGSREKLIRKIQEMLDHPGTFSPGTYRQTIHEMEEMRALAMGQYAHNNQPVHHVLWLLMALDTGESGCDASDPLSPKVGSICPRWRGETLIHEVLHRAYGYNFYAGDEDNGEQGAWYVLAALGLFDPAPGTMYGYALGSPLFQQVDIYRDPSMIVGETQPSLTIQSLQAGTVAVRHVHQVLLNGQDIGLPGSDSRLGWTVSYEELFQSRGVLRFLTGQELVTDSADPAASAPPATAPAGTPHAGPSDSTGVLLNLQRQLKSQQQSHQNTVHKLEEALEQQRQELQRLGQKGKSSSVDQAVLDQTREQLKQEQNQMQQLEQQLRLQQDESRRHQIRVESDMNAGMTTIVEVAFLILMMVNVLGWFLCTRYRGPPPSRRKRVNHYNHHNDCRKVHSDHV